MKITFDAPYRDLERVINSSAHSVSKSGTESFGVLLNEINPENQVKKSKIVPEKNENYTYHDVIPENYSSLQSEIPEIMTPTVQPISIPVSSDESLTVLEVRRIKNAKQVASLSQQERMKIVKPLIEKAGREQGIDPSLGMSVAATESAFNPLAISKDGHNSKGLFQLLDSTGHDMQKRLDEKKYYDPFNPEQNIKLGIAYLRYLHEIFSTNTPLATGLETVSAANSASLEKLAVAAFNAGEGRVAAAQKRATRAGFDPTEYAQVESYLPESTRKYVQKVLASKSVFDVEFKG